MYVRGRVKLSVAVAIFALCLFLSSPVRAAGDLIFYDLPVAYTLTPFTKEIFVNYFLVNDFIDFLDLREKTVGTHALDSKMGDYNAWRIGVNLGIPSGVHLGYFLDRNKIRIDVGRSSTFVEASELDDLKTTEHRFFLRKLLFKEGRLRPAFSIEISYLRHKANDVGFRFTGLNLSDLYVVFSTPKKIVIADMEDTGWSLATLLSKTYENFLFTFYMSYSVYEVENKVYTNIPIREIRTNFNRKFDITERQLRMGIMALFSVSVNTSLFMEYTYLKLSRDVSTDQPLNTSALARYTNPESLVSEDANHVIRAGLYHWFNDHLSLLLEGRLMANQFLGLRPLYNNPFTARFMDRVYGFVGAGLNFQF